MAEPKKNRFACPNVDSKVANVVAANGRAPNLINGFSAAEKQELAKLCDDEGNLAAGHAEQFRLFMIKHNDQHKATEAADEGDA